MLKIIALHTGFCFLNCTLILSEINNQDFIEYAVKLQLCYRLTKPIQEKTHLYPSQEANICLWKIYDLSLIHI